MESGARETKEAYDSVPGFKQISSEFEREGSYAP